MSRIPPIGTFSGISLLYLVLGAALKINLLIGMAGMAAIFSAVNFTIVMLSRYQQGTQFEQDEDELLLAYTLCQFVVFFSVLFFPHIIYSGEGFCMGVTILGLALFNSLQLLRSNRSKGQQKAE